MSDLRIAQLEKEMAVIQATVPPLIQKMDESTSAMTKLASEISSLVNSNKYIHKGLDELRNGTNANSARISTLENKSAVRDSKAQVLMWIERTTVIGIVLAILKSTNII